MSALPFASDGGSVTAIVSVCRYSRPVAAPLDFSPSGMPSRDALVLVVLRVRRDQLVQEADAWRALRATSVMPFLCAVQLLEQYIGR